MPSDMEKLKKKLLKFATDRNWEKFHSPKNLAMSLSCEAAELLEHFVWLTEEESTQVMQDPQKAEAVRQEIGDVLNNLVYLADRLGVDPLQAAHDKILLNEQKYPIDAAQEFARRHER